MAQDKKQVEQITDMEVDFAKWFTDVCRKAELIDYSSIKGMFILRPYGYAIWENFQKILDEKFKETGHENVYLPMLIPESLLQKEKDHVEGFAPECAWVTMGGSEKLEEVFQENLYMAEIYPQEESRTALEVFRVAEGSGEYFDLSVTPIYRDTFTLGREQKKEDRDHGNPDIKQRKEE